MELISNKYDKINILGGEPTLHPKINEIVKKLYKKTKVVIMSNLTSDISNVSIKENIRWGASIGHIQSDYEYEVFKKNVEKIGIKNIGFAIVAGSNNKENDRHIKYLERVYNDFIITEKNDICIFTENPDEKFIQNEKLFSGFLNKAKYFINDYKNIINIRNKHGIKNPIYTNCVGLYRCLFKDKKDLEFVKENIKNFRHGCNIRFEEKAWLQDNNLYMCPSTKKFNNNFYNKKPPMPCAKCKYFKTECGGACKGFYLEEN